MPTFRHEQPQDLNAIETLLDQVFGDTRHAKISYRYRDGVSPVETLSHVGHDGGELVATIRFWPIAIGPEHQPALLLGPIAVRPERKGEGIGVRLIELTLKMAANMGWGIVILVGDAAYYNRFGFGAAADYGIVMPDENPERVQVRFLNEEMKHVSGKIEKAR